MYPDMGNVCFSAGLHGWAFTLTTFAKLYAQKFGIDEDRMMKKLWGDNFFDPATKKWTTKQTDSETCKRGYVQFIYQPIAQVRPAAPHPRVECKQQRQPGRHCTANGRACLVLSKLGAAAAAAAADPL